MITTPDVLLEKQKNIEMYRSSFAIRSGGVQLPSITYIGEFSTKVTSRNMSDLYISIPVKNQEAIIESVLTMLIDNTNLSFSIGLLFDNCTDNSLQLCADFFENKYSLYPNLISVHFIKSDGELFEATAENITFLFCGQKYFMSLQSDIYFADKSFLARAIRVFEEKSNVFAISGKAIVSFKIMSKLQTYLSTIFHSYNILLQIFPKARSKRKLGCYFPFLGYFGDLSRPPKSFMGYSRKQLSSFYIGEAVIRGPILWRSAIFRKLSGFDDIGFPLGRDDCDLCFRAYIEGYLSGYMPCESYSIYNQGTTRKPRSIADQKALTEREVLARKFPGDLARYWNGSKELHKKICRAQQLRKREKSLRTFQ